MIVVADTGPVHYLVLCGQIELMHRLFDSLLLPPAVHRELLHPHAPQKVQTWASTLPDWAKIQSPQNATRFGNLGPGEREALSLALEAKADFLLIDETLGRRIAVQEGIAVKGTLGVLEEAAARGMIELRTVTDQLKNTGIFLAPAILDAALERDRLRR